MGMGMGMGIAMGGSGRRSSGEISSSSSYAAAAAGRKGVIQVGGVDAGLHIVTGSEKSRREKEKEKGYLTFTPSEHSLILLNLSYLVLLGRE